jgi:hypothetical protein
MNLLLFFAVTNNAAASIPVYTFLGMCGRVSVGEESKSGIA